MPYRCPQCGATYRTKETCEERFNAGQALEFTDPAYFAVHHLSVPCYMLQHTRYSRDGWIRVRQTLARFLDGFTPEQAREEARKEAQAHGGGTRAPSLTRGPELDGVDSLVWTRTVADVWLDSAEHYCADTQAWATQVVRDSDGLMRAE